MALGFLVPLVFLTSHVIVRSLRVGFDPSLFRHTFSTAVTIAAAATLLTLALGFGVAFALRLVRRRYARRLRVHRRTGLRGAGHCAGAGAARTGSVAVDEAINALTRSVAGAGVGLVLAGSSAAVVIAYAVRFLAIATGFAQAGLARISTELDDAARTIGTRPSGVVLSIQLPLMRPALRGAALLVFVDCLKELPATLLLRPLNVETLSTYIYQFAVRGNFEEGALAALIIVLVGIFPVIRMVRHADEAATGRGYPTSDLEHLERSPLDRSSSPQVQTWGIEFA